MPVIVVALAALAIAGCNGARSTPTTDAELDASMDAGARDTGAPPAVEPPEPCRLTQCEAGQLATCDLSFGIDCRSFGGSCAEAELTVGETTEAAPWCSCGDLVEGFGTCAADYLVICESGAPQFFECLPGTACGIQDDLLDCYCLNEPDGVCPGELCPADPDCAICTPSCAGAVCGDNGCAGSCGSCEVGSTCESGTCVAPCLPSCTAGRCGGADGCGGVCGCAAGESCEDGVCTSGCTPSCPPGACGDDGCGGTCACPSGQSCEAGSCVACTPDCSGGRVCGSDGCGGSCGACPAAESCEGQFDGTPDTRWCGCFFGDHVIDMDGSAAGLSNGSPIRFAEVYYRSSPEIDGRPESERRWDVRTLTADELIKTGRYGDTCMPSFEVEVRIRSNVGSDCVIGPQRLTGVSRVDIPNIDTGCPAAL